MTCRPDQWPRTTDELLPRILFDLSAQFPDSTYAEYPITDNVADGYRKITFREVANAVHEVAYWIDNNVGKPVMDDGSETLVYMGPNDLRYGILVLASVMVGYKMLFPTPRYGVEATNTLISLANGSVMLMPAEPDPVALEVVAKRSMPTFKIPSIEQLLASKPKVYPYTKTFAVNKHEPLICLHTSGTTGFPKPIVWTHDWADSVARSHYLPDPAGYELSEQDLFNHQKRIMSLFPRMHASGMITALVLPIYLGVILVHPPSRVVSHEAVNAAIEALEAVGRVDGLALPPPHVEYLGTNPAMLNKAKKLVETIMWAGGAISDTTGSALSAELRVYNFLASTEMGIWAAVSRTGPVEAKTVHNEFQYFTFHSALNIRFDALSEGEEGTLYEAKMAKNEGESAWVQPIFKIFTDVNEIALGDLFVRHPFDAAKWKYAGRADDMLTFLGSEKFYPGALERELIAHPAIAEAIIVGTRWPKASLLVRLHDDADIENVWEYVEKASKNLPVYAQVTRHMIVQATKPFPKTAKGSVQRSATLKLYEEQLSALYEKDGRTV